MGDMKPYAIRVPEEVQKRLKEMDTDYIRQVLIEVAGMTYTEEKRLIHIERLVKKYIEENIERIQINEYVEADENMTEKAIESIMEIMQ